jgi:hypothetical protein
MPFSFDPQPADNETQCARCGAIFYIDLTRCPECGVNLYEPDDEQDDFDLQDRGSKKASLISKIDNFIRRLSGKPYAASEVFGDALDQAFLYDNLLKKVGGDHAVVERLVEFEREQVPAGSRLVWLQNAIQRWERDNRISGSSSGPA